MGTKGCDEKGGEGEDKNPSSALRLNMKVRWGVEGGVGEEPSRSVNRADPVGATPDEGTTHWVAAAAAAASDGPLLRQRTERRVSVCFREPTNRRTVPSVL